jgi:hypothetical protein
MSTITNISDGANIQISIYFNPQTLHDENITEYIQEPITDVSVNFSWQVIPNNSLTTQFTEIISDIHRNMVRDENEDINLCEGRINIETAISETIPNAHVIIAVHSKSSDRQLYGFAVANFLNGGATMYLEILCSHTNIVRGGGYILINTLEKMCRIIGCNVIELHSVKSAVDTYAKYGFIPDEACRRRKREFRDFCRMTKDLRPVMTDEEREATTAKLLTDDVEFGGTNKRRTNKRRKPRKSRSNKRYNKRLTNKHNTKRIK